MSRGKRVNTTPLLYASAAGLPRREFISLINASVVARYSRIPAYLHFESEMDKKKVGFDESQDQGSPRQVRGDGPSTPPGI